MNPYPLKYSDQIEMEDYKSFFEEIMQHTEGKHWGIPNPKAKYELVGKANSFYLQRLRTNNHFVGPYVYGEYDKEQKIIQTKIGYPRTWMLIFLVPIGFSAFIGFDKGWLAFLIALASGLLVFYFFTFIFHVLEFEKLKKAALSLKKYPGVKKS